jgi:iron(III) transport system ATP-binding protein
MRFEIRRLHERYKITTVYVTHDQAEAMVIADRIAVMNQGRIEQVGTGEEIYERPRTEFVARFIGQTNLLPGHLGTEPGTVSVFGSLLRTAGGSHQASPVAPGEPVAVSIRPSDIGIRPAEAANGAERGVNVLSGRVLRAYYLGPSRDYQVELTGTDGVCVRVIAPPEAAIGPGQAVSLGLPIEKCRVLAS